MPAVAEILEQLRSISNDLAGLSIFYHLLILAFLISLLKGWGPGARLLGVMLSIPLLSVSIIAWMYGNPFNGTLFLVFFILLFIFSLTLPFAKSTITRGWSLIAAMVMITFGWFYPHFLEQDYLYVIAAPTGLIPCPTLSLVMGFALLFNGLHSKKWAITLSVIALFYGLFGAFKLHVFIDVGLLAGALALILQITTLNKLQK